MLEIIGLPDAVLLETTRTPAEIAAVASRPDRRVTVGPCCDEHLDVSLVRPLRAPVPVRLTWSPGDTGATRLRVSVGSGAALSLAAHRAINHWIAGLAETLDARAVSYLPAA